MFFIYILHHFATVRVSTNVESLVKMKTFLLIDIEITFQPIICSRKVFLLYSLTSLVL